MRTPYFSSPAVAGPPSFFGSAYTHHVMQIGQSNGSGAFAVPPYTNQSLPGLLMLNALAAGVSGTDGIRAPSNRLVSPSEYTALVPLKESEVVDNSRDIDPATGHFIGLNSAAPYGETSLGSMLNDIRNRFPGFAGVASTNSVSGMVYSKQARGTDPYTNGLVQLRAIRNLLPSDRPSRIFALTLQHGESDAIFNNTSYAVNLRQWLADWTADIKIEIPGQTSNPVMIAAQVSFPVNKVTATQLLVASLAEPRILIACPGYAVETRVDGHHTAYGQRHLGGHFARIYRLVVLQGQAWSPLRPLSAVLAGSTVTVTLSVPVLPLALDTPHGKALLTAGGFDYTDDSMSATATSASIVGNTVRVTLSGVPSGANKRMRYATGQWGNLRDSDPATAGPYGDRLFNWCVHFDMAIT